MNSTIMHFEISLNEYTTYIEIKLIDRDWVLCQVSAIILLLVSIAEIARARPVHLHVTTETTIIL